MARTIVVFIPGVMGSCLQTPDKRLIWPGSVAELVLPYAHMQDLMRDDLEAFDIIRTVSISEQYAGLIEHLNRCGFREDDLPPTLYACPYDWRKDNALAARQLRDKISRALSDHAKTGAEIILVAHSMGGLVSRCFLESDAYQDDPEWLAVKALVTLGTPHRGAPLALTAAMGLEKRVFLNADQVRLLASDPRFPSLYQMLPPRGEPFVWEESQGFRTVDVYEIEAAASLQLVPEQLKAATRFHESLSFDRRPKHVRYFLFAGTRQKTITNIGLREDPARPGAYLLHSVKRVETEDGGDGTVPSWSGAITSLQSQYVGGEHSVIYRTRELRLTLSGLLGKPGIANAERREFELTLKDHVVEPAATLGVLLTFHHRRTEVNGELRMVPTDAVGQTKAYPVRYGGLEAANLTVIVPAPAAPGIYRVAFYEANQELGTDELFVQAQ